MTYPRSIVDLTLIFDHLKEMAATAPTENGLREGHAFHSYGALVERIERLAAGFRERGLVEGDVAGLLIPNSVDLFVVAHALFAIGVAAMPFDPQSTSDELTRLFRRIQLHAFVAAPRHIPKIASVRDQAAPGAPIFATNELASLERTPLVTPSRMDPDTPALYLHSSGSTGLPKVVPHTHSQLLADGMRTSDAWQLSPDDLVVNVLPPNFAMGFLLGIIDAPYRGASTLFWNDPLPLALARRKLLEAMSAHGVSVIGAVPAMYGILAGDTGASDLRLRLAFSGGAALSRATFDAARHRLGTPLRQSYGSTEAIFVSHNAAQDINSTWNSVGLPGGDAEVRIAVTESGDASDAGELEVRSSSLMHGYHDNPSANSDAFDDGWFRSGDLASIDDQGQIFIQGRIKLLIEVSGFKVNPLEIEEVIASHPAVAELAVMAIPDPRTGNRLRAVVVRKHDVSADEIKGYAREVLSSHKVPGEVAFVESLPRSSTGKLLRAQLAAL